MKSFEMQSIIEMPVYNLTFQNLPQEIAEKVDKELLKLINQKVWFCEIYKPDNLIDAIDEDKRTITIYDKIYHEIVKVKIPKKIKIDLEDIASDIIHYICGKQYVDLIECLVSY